VTSHQSNSMTACSSITSTRSAKFSDSLSLLPSTTNRNSGSSYSSMSRNPSPSSMMSGTQTISFTASIVNTRSILNSLSSSKSGLSSSLVTATGEISVSGAQSDASTVSSKSTFISTHTEMVTNSAYVSTTLSISSLPSTTLQPSESTLNSPSSDGTICSSYSNSALQSPTLMADSTIPTNRVTRTSIVTDASIPTYRETSTSLGTDTATQTSSAYSSLTSTQTSTATGIVSIAPSLSPTASATLSLGLKKVEEFIGVPALVFRCSFTPQLNILDVTLGSLVRRLWSVLLQIRIEFVVISDVTSVQGTIFMNISDASNVAGNPYGLNTTDAIMNAFLNWVNPVVSSSKTLRRQLFAGDTTTTTSIDTGSTLSLLRHGARTTRRALGAIFLKSPPVVKPKVGRTDISINVFAKTIENADALKATILLLTTDDIAAGLALVLSSNTSTAFSTLRRASNTTSFTVELDKSSVFVTTLEYRYYYYGVFLDFLLANIRYVVGAAVGFIVAGILITYLKRCLLRLKAAAAERHDAKKMAAVAAAKHALKVRMFHSRMRAAFRKLVRESRLDKRAAFREVATEARETVLLERAEEVVHVHLTRAAVDMVTTVEVHNQDTNVLAEESKLSGVLFDVVTAVSDDDDVRNLITPPLSSSLPLPAFFAIEALLKSESSIYVEPDANDEEFVPPPPQSQPLAVANFRINSLFQSFGDGGGEDNGDVSGGCGGINPVSEGDESQGMAQGSVAQTNKQIAEAARHKFRQREARTKHTTFKKF
jgi:hypothetical protein